MVTSRAVVFVAVSLIAVASCAADEAMPTPSSALDGRGPDSISTAATSGRSEESATPVTSVAITTSTLLGPVDDGGVLAAAVLWRATTRDGRNEPDRFSHLYIVERLGRADADGFITGVESGRALTAAERAAVEAALAPRTVEWVESWDAVVDEQATTTLPEDRAIVTVAEPLVEGARAEVSTELWCGYECATGSTLVVERSPSGDWAVTDEIVNWVA